MLSNLLFAMILQVVSLFPVVKGLSQEGFSLYNYRRNPKQYCGAQHVPYYIHAHESHLNSPPIAY